MLKRLRKEQAGQGLVEYTLIIALVSVILIGALGVLGEGFDNVFSDIGDTLTDAGS